MILPLYGKVQSCNSTYDVQNKNAIMHQYNNTIDCVNKKCRDAVNQFVDAAKLATDGLTSILNKEEFKFSTYVSCIDRKYMI